MKKSLLLPILLAVSIVLPAYGATDYEVSDITQTMKEGDKLAILMVHFGTTHNDTKVVTIDALYAKVRELYPQYEAREAYTSRIIIKRLAAGGVHKNNPTEALQQLAKDGYTHVVVQATVLIDGVEMESLVRNVNQLKDLFKELRIGSPLLYKPNDYERVADAIIKHQNANTAYVWVGHGTYDSSTAQYTMLDYMLKSKGYTNNIVGTIEGYPTFDDALAQLKSTGLKRVELVPFLFVAGEHAKNDINGDWKEGLEGEGYEVSMRMEGLGEDPEIQAIFLSHLSYAFTHKKLDILDKKATYEQAGEKY